ncbi:PKD domain-containing protein [Halomicrococcus gelatinilyticus]|uniref:PKD domain-containing protein n=1 Tax=Halomicrococcus gelatinilyticus TaxID=1702103 RepID=UPI002E154B68
MKIVGASFAALVLLAAAMSLPVVAANEAPLADAGLDQDVSKGTTVYLDATGSRDPDGRIERYDWSIETPSGGTTDPRCGDCSRTRFEPNAVGTYAVTLTVTDDDGATSTDTFYVTVSPGEPPSMDLSGPQTTVTGNSNTYTATAEAGAASLAYVVWSVDGTEVANTSLSGVQGVDTLTRTFPAAGNKTISATVVDVDGQRTTETISASVSAPASPSPDPPTDRRTSAERYSPNVQGEDVVTGATPLRATYRITGGGGSITLVEWMANSRMIGTGEMMTTTWKPGDHSLYAVVTYADGSTDVARFGDGSTTVVADPKPEVNLTSLDQHDVISGTGVGTDAYGNLMSVTVKLDGGVVGRSGLSLKRGEVLRRSQEVQFSHRDFEPGKSYELTVVAVDGRGQRTTVTKTIEPTKSPDIVEAGFVNGPVDSYHERIDRDRYAAHHRMKIDLNGMDASDVVVGYSHTKNQTHNLPSMRHEHVKENLLIIHTYWAANKPGEYQIGANIHSRHNKEGVKKKASVFEVTPSPPEMRAEVIDDGTPEHYPRRWGLVVDAGASFDPDGTRIRYAWSTGATPISKDNSTAKFTHTQIVDLTIKDGNNQTTSRDFHFLDRYVPRIQDVKVINDTKFKSTDDVRIKVKTRQYRFPKNRYHKKFGLGIDVEGASGDVVKWEKKIINEENDSVHIDDPRRYVGILEVDASDLAGNIKDPSVRVFNEKHHATSKEVDLPHVTVLRRYGEVWRNTTIENVEYLVKRPIYDWVSTDSPTEKERFQNEGYSVVDKEQQGREYLIEERVKVSDAKYRTVTRSFENRWRMESFVDQHRKWSSAGATSREVTRTVTETAWYDSKSGRGTFTGETRRVKTEPAEYRNLKQFAYERDIRKTGTRTVTKTKEVTVTRTGTKTVRKCPLPNLCYDVEKKTTYQTTVEKTYTTTETYTYTVSRTETYWATRKTGGDHWATGKRKRVKVSDAEYETQYRYQYTHEVTETILRYEATKRKKIRDARYEWQKKTTLDSFSDAQSLARTDGYRIGGTEPKIRWTLNKPKGTQTKQVPVYLKKDEVVKTYATVTGDVKEKFVYIGEDRTKLVDLGERTVDETFYGKMSREEIREKAGEFGDESDTDGRCLEGGGCVTG